MKVILATSPRVASDSSRISGTSPLLQPIIRKETSQNKLHQSGGTPERIKYATETERMLSALSLGCKLTIPTEGDVARILTPYVNTDSVILISTDSEAVAKAVLSFCETENCPVYKNHFESLKFLYNDTPQ